MKKRFVLLVVAALVATAFPMAAAGADPGPALTPASVTENVALGGAFNVQKTVHTPAIPPNPAIVFLADTTGSMGPALANVQAGATPIMNVVQAAQPTAVFGVAEYRDQFDAFAFQLNQALTANIPTAQAAINGWVAGGGGDTMEAQLNALTQLAGLAYPAGSTPIIVWFGDASGHDPSLGATLASTILALQNGGITVLAVDVGLAPATFSDGLDNTGQATAIAAATNGSFLLAPNPAQVSATILAGLQNLPADVSMATNCAAPITASFAPASQIVTSGTDAVFTETITVAANAAPGVYACIDWAIINGQAMVDAAGDLIVERKRITVVAATCDPTQNPHGNQKPVAPGNGGQGQNQDGFYEIGSTSGEDVSVDDDGSAAVFGPFSNGTEIKYVEDDTAVPSISAMGANNAAGGGAGNNQGNDTDWQIIGNGDALVTYTDGFGNVTVTACLVPPPPK